MVWELQGLARPWEAWDAQRYPAMCQQKFSQNKGLPRTCRSSGCYSNRHRSKKWSGSCKALRGPGRPGTPRDIQRCASKNSHRTRGCRAHVEALDVIATVTDRRNGLGAARPCEALGGLGRPEISSDVPAKILTEQGAAAHMSKLWML